MRKAKERGFPSAREQGSRLRVERLPMTIQRTFLSHCTPNHTETTGTGIGTALQGSQGRRQNLWHEPGTAAVSSRSPMAAAGGAWVPVLWGQGLMLK